MKNIRFVYWTMDLQPELSLVAGYMKAGSIPAKSMQKCGDYVFHQSDKIIVLDDYMKAAYQPAFTHRKVRNRCDSRVAGYDGCF